MPVLTKINTNVIADDAVTAAKIPADALGATDIAANAIGTSEIATGGVLPANIAYLGDGTGNLSGTITNQQLHFGTAFTLTDNLTVNGDVTLGKVRDDGTGQSITGDGRTLTGTGTLTMGSSFEGGQPGRDDKTAATTSVTGLGGTLGSASMPAGSIVQTSDPVTFTTYTNGWSDNSWADTVITGTFTPDYADSDVIVISRWWCTLNNTSSDVGYSLRWKRAVSGETDVYPVAMNDSATNSSSGTAGLYWNSTEATDYVTAREMFLVDNEARTAATQITYTMQYTTYSGDGTFRIGTGNAQRASLWFMEVKR